MESHSPLTSPRRHCRQPSHSRRSCSFWSWHATCTTLTARRNSLCFMIAVSSLLNALERDVYSAAERCWRLEDKVVTLRGGAAAVVTLRAKAVCLQVRQAALWWKEQ